LSSTALAPAQAAVVLACLSLLRSDAAPRARLQENVGSFRGALAAEGLTTADGEHPAVCVSIGHAVQAQRLTDFLYRRGVFAIGFCHPIVPEGAARIRAQVTARHTEAQLTRAAKAFGEGARELQIL
jgi:glycine C-acetyltransferase